MMEICKVFEVHAAHRLPNVPPSHPCGRPHGHTFRIEVYVEGPVDKEMGWVIDFAEVDGAFRPLHQQLDHHLLNEVPGLENPTCENIAMWIWARLQAQLDGLAKIAVAESSDAFCVYRGPGS